MTLGIRRPGTGRTPLPSVSILYYGGRECQEDYLAINARAVKSTPYFKETGDAYVRPFGPGEPSFVSPDRVAFESKKYFDKYMESVFCYFTDDDMDAWAGFVTKWVPDACRRTAVDGGLED